MITILIKLSILSFFKPCIFKEIEFLGKKTQIIAISKNHPREFVEEALKQGIKIFGENRVQEAEKKFQRTSLFLNFQP